MDVRRYVEPVFQCLRKIQPETLHCWLDHSNIWGGVAAILQGTPKIILSGRNINPTSFGFFTYYLHDFYRWLLGFKNVKLINNTRSGAASYARWLALPPRKIQVIPNGVDTSRFRPFSENSKLRIRKKLRLKSHQPVLLGIFRLSEEKCPHVFIRIIQALERKGITNLQVLHAGEGPLLEKVRALSRQKLQTPVRFLGPTNKPEELYNIATCTILCSRAEGAPNVLLESQACATPVS